MTQPLNPRWLVRQASRTAWGGTWYKVYDPSGNCRALYADFRAAVLEADRQARTREYVLPRLNKSGYIATTDEQTAMEGTGYDHTAKTVAWVEEPGTIGLAIGDCDHYMTTEGAHSVALALAALTEQEGAA